MQTYVALLRGINVGGNTPVSMAELKTCFEALGFEHVRTYINSGNVIFKTAHANARDIEAIIEKALHTTFSYTISVVVRSLPEMHDLIAHLPASWAGANTLRCNVIFLRHEIDTPTIVAQFAPRAAVDEVHYRPGVLFWSSETSNIGKSNLSKIAGTPTYKQITIRIVRTVQKIYAIMQEVDKA